MIGTTIVPDLSSSIPVIHQSTTASVIANYKNDDVDLNDQILTLQKKVIIF